MICSTTASSKTRGLPFKICIKNIRPRCALTSCAPKRASRRYAMRATVLRCHGERRSAVLPTRVLLSAVVATAVSAVMATALGC